MTFFTSVGKSLRARLPNDCIHVFPNIAMRSFRTPVAVRSGRAGTRLFLEGDREPFLGYARWIALHRSSFFIFSYMIPKLFATATSSAFLTCLEVHCLEPT